MSATVENYNATNHNLSSILAQIQDNGPAYAETTQRRAADNSASNANSVDTRVQANTNDEDTVSLSTASVQQQVSKKPRPSSRIKKEISPGVWLQLLLLLISAALLAATLFRLDIQNNNLEDSLSVYDETIEEKIQESVDLQNNNSGNRDKKINTALKLLQDDLLAIKTDYTTLDKKYSALEQQKSSLQNEPDNFKQQITSLKNELHTAKQKLNIIHTKKLKTENTAKSNGLTVSLASLSNKLKAESIVQQLYAEGLLPNMTQAFVNGVHVYRLSVSGFDSIEQAELFLLKAETKYGMKDSRIRKG